MAFAVRGFSSSAEASASPNAEVTMPSTSPLPSFVLVWPSNCGSRTFTDTTAVRPSRKFSPVGLSSGEKYFSRRA
jgi:hypothetical protein